MPRAKWSALTRDVCSAQPVVSSIHLLFLGSLGYRANIDALDHFSSSWACALEGCGHGRSTVLVGSGSVGRRLRRLAAEVPCIRIVGRVEEVRDAYCSHDALIVPLRLGGGSLLDVLEGLLYGIPIISTTVGVEGLPVRPGVHFLSADSGGEARDAATRLMRESDLCSRLSAAARDLAAVMSWKHSRRRR